MRLFVRIRHPYMLIHIHICACMHIHMPKICSIINHVIMCHSISSSPTRTHGTGWLCLHKQTHIHTHCRCCDQLYNHLLEHVGLDISRIINKVQSRICACDGAGVYVLDAACASCIQKEPAAEQCAQCDTFSHTFSASHSAKTYGVC